MNKIILITVALSGTFYLCFRGAKKINPNPAKEIGAKLDSLNGVYVFYNGGIDNVEERNLTDDGYNLGLKFQCVEFVKRYYYQHYHHKMPDSYGHAKDFFDPELKDGSYNVKRDLVQYCNPCKIKPRTGDLLIFDGNNFNPYGHVAIISQVNDSLVEIIQQNPGPFAPTRDTYDLIFNDNRYFVGHSKILGWLRMR